MSSSLLLFVAVCAPDVICPDRRQRVLPLIFARPLTGSDYVLAKLGAIASIVFAFSFLPQVLLFVGQTLVSKDGSLDYMQDNADVLWKVPVAVRRWPPTTPRLSLAVSSLTARRVVAGASVFGVTIISSIVAGDPARGRRARRARPAVQRPRPAAATCGTSCSRATSTKATSSPACPGPARWPWPPTSPCSAVSVGVLLWRYRWAER